MTPFRTAFAVFCLLFLLPPAARADGGRIFEPDLAVATQDGAYSARLFGRLQLDAFRFDEDRVQRSGDGDVRRARLGLRGELGPVASYKVELDFTKDDPEFRDAYLAFRLPDQLTLFAGNMKPPQGMDQNISSNDILFTERAAVINTLTRGHTAGVALAGGTDDWGIKAGVFNRPFSDDAGLGGDTYSGELRAHADLLPHSDDVLHIGASASYRSLQDDTLSLRQAPTGIGSPSIVSTGSLGNVDHLQVYGLELAGRHGPFSWQSEYLAAQAARTGAADAAFSGGYAQAGFLLTGESRPYNGNIGLFGRVKPARPFNPAANQWGAVEAKLRYDRLDLSDRAVRGGTLDQYALGANWYLYDNLRLMADYTFVQSQNGSAGPGDDPQVLHLRAQWDF